MALVVGGANAATIPADVLDSEDIGNVAIAMPVPAAGTAYITCAQVCLGWNGATFGTGSFSSSTNADVYDMQWEPSAANELEELKFVSGNDSLAGYDYVAGGDSPIDILVAAGTYIKLKFGSFGTPGAGFASAFFYVADAQTITYYQNGQKGGGLSHTASTSVPPVPVPAAGFLMIGALGGLAALRRRTRAA
jgi:hypothetical protein